MKISFKILGMIAAVVMAAMLPVAASAKSKGKAEIKFAESTYNFGTIAENKGTVSHEF